MCGRIGCGLVTGGKAIGPDDWLVEGWVGDANGFCGCFWRIGFGGLC